MHAMPKVWNFILALQDLDTAHTTLSDNDAFSIVSGLVACQNPFDYNTLEQVVFSFFASGVRQN